MTSNNRRISVLKFSFYLLIGLAILVLLLGILFLKLLDNTPYRQCDFYKKTCREISLIRPCTNDPEDTILAGWSRVNLKPEFGTPIAIDANRKGAHFAGVHDSIYVRAFVFKNKFRKVAYISADLLIIPPEVTQLIDSVLKPQGFDENNIFLSATHTHCSIGSWQNTLVGEIFAGKYDPRVPAHIVSRMSQAILEAEKNVSKVKIGYTALPTHKMVYNRLVEDKGKLDSLVRIVKFEKEDGSTASIITFTAHATCLHDRVMDLSGDWPGIMMHNLDSSGLCGFTSFSAGAVGSHGPYKCKKNKWVQLKYISSGVTDTVMAHMEDIPMKYMSELQMVHQPVYLRDPQFRINSFLVVRPWAFNHFFGVQQAYVNTLRIGNNIFMGMPCDFSGELSATLDNKAADLNSHLLITSFNGCFIGYITDDRWYSMNAYETRTMNWFGPGNGSYLSEVALLMIRAVSSSK